MIKVKNSVEVFDDKNIHTLRQKVNVWLHGTGMEKDIHSVNFFNSDSQHYAYVWYTDKI
ncbi:hypothetical protein [Paenibacillus sp. Soil750]|uniref:hypothetical protein n=1 Tax=Paenibacillus sp. Soil750 TaxID=1736398 RepID=UPI000A3F6ABB|nr:hypothetical protein [Paenibacillus sp. Soil750]